MSARAPAPDSNRNLIYGGVGAAAILILAVIALTGGGEPVKKKKPKRRKPNPVAPATRDWYAEGRKRGYDWRRHRGERGWTQADVDDIAEKMTYLELSADNSFMNEFTSALFLPHTHLKLFPSVAQMLGDEGA